MTNKTEEEDFFEKNFEKIKNNIRDGSFLGETIDIDDIKQLVVCSYFLGKHEARVELIDDFDSSMNYMRGN